MQPLSRYLQIVSGAARPRYLAARSIGVDVPSSLEGRWKEHSAAVKRSRTLSDDAISPWPSLLDSRPPLPGRT